MDCASPSPTHSSLSGESCVVQPTLAYEIDRSVRQSSTHISGNCLNERPKLSLAQSDLLFCSSRLSDIDHRPGKLEIINADALALDERAILPSGARIASNIPYNVGTGLLIKWLTGPTWPPFWSSLTLMFQREVAERIVAQPGTKAYGRLAVLAQWRTRTRLVLTLKPEAFTPPPAVASAVVELTPLSSVDCTATAPGGGSATVTACTDTSVKLDLSGAGNPDGDYSVSVTATDQVGNTSIAGQATYTFDTTAPTQPGKQGAKRLITSTAVTASHVSFAGRRFAEQRWPAGRCTGARPANRM